MHSERERLALETIRDNIELARRFVSGMDRESFEADDRTHYAVVRCLEIISEASRRLEDSTKRKHPSIDWSRVAGAGNVYRHDYDNVLASYVWITVQESLDPLQQVVLAELRLKQN